MGISKLLNECLLSYLSNGTRFSQAMKFRSFEPKPYSSIRQTVLRLLSEFLNRSEKEMMGLGLRLGIFERRQRGTTKRLFTETGSLGMLERQDYDNIDLVLPFIDEIVDVCCGYSKTPPVTEVLINYVELLQIIRKKRSSWLDGS